jgi:hypothetical protein
MPAAGASSSASNYETGPIHLQSRVGPHLGRRDAALHAQRRFSPVVLSRWEGVS